MQTDFIRIQELIDRPSESLAVEIKTWINPDKPEGQAKIVRAALALRNHGGGYLVIGFDDSTLKPSPIEVGWDVHDMFHVDKIQGLISRFASEPFEVAVGFGKRDDQYFPVLVIPAGIRTPVVAKSDLLVDSKKIVATDDVYVRTLRSNNTPSTAKAAWKDWGQLVEICFDNREADIGRFLRRHLGGITPLALQQLATTLGGEIPQLSTEDRLTRLLDNGEKRFQELIEERNLELPKTGWWEVALIIDGDVPSHLATKEFLSLLDVSNPDFTGWPMWLDTRRFGDASTHPFINAGTWEALVNMRGLWSRHIDFMRLNPEGQFYLRWALQEDITDANDAPAPNKAFDFSLPVTRCTEAIAVGLAFAKAMGCNPEQCALRFAFRWSGLKSRMLNSWVHPERMISSGHTAYQDRVTVFQQVPLDTPLSAIGGLLASMLKPLYSVFDGFELNANVTEDLSARLVERRL